MRVADALAQLLECAVEAIDPPVCRTFTNPGFNAPHDNCQSTVGGNGQLWVGNGRTTPGWPSPTGDVTNCATPFGETIELGIVRCAQGKLDDDGIPDADLVTADAEMQQDDKRALRNAILCCLGVDGKDLIIEGWEAIEPQGGCVGGVWTITVRDAGCDCSFMES